MGADVVGIAVLAFLDRHRLPHSPRNYAFAHRYLEARDDAFHAEVAAIVDDGVRVTPAHVERLMPALEHAPGEQPQTLDHLASDVMGIIDDAAAEARDFTKTLTLAAVELVSSGNRKIHDVVATTIANAERAEAQLRDMGRRTAEVRERLQALSAGFDLDSTTALLNRMATDAFLATKLGREVASVTVAIVSIDQMTAIGTVHGLQVVERVVRILAETLRDHCLPHRVGRWEAKSVAVIFEDVTLDAARSKLQDAQAAFTARQLKKRGTDEPIGTLSFSAALASVPAGPIEEWSQVLTDLHAIARSRCGISIPGQR